MNRIFKTIFISILPVICLYSCNAKEVSLETTIFDVKSAPFEDIVITASVKEFKNAGFRYGDLITYSYVDADDNIHQNTVPFVSNYLTAGLFTGSICDYEKAGKNINISLGFTNDYDKIKPGIDSGLIGKSINFKLAKKDGWKKYYDLIPLGSKNTYNSVNRDNYVFSNFRDVKTVYEIEEHGNIGNNTIFRSSCPFDHLYNFKRYSYADKAFGDLMALNQDYRKNIIFVNLNYNEFVKTIKTKNGREEEIKFVDLRKDATSPNFSNYINNDTYGKEGSNHISINMRDNSFSILNIPYIKSVFEGIIDAVQDMKNKLEEDEIGSYHIIFTDTDGIIRTGFICAILELLAGVKYEAVVSDYMLSFKNYYDIVIETEEYNVLRSFTIDRFIWALLNNTQYGSKEFPPEKCYENLKITDWQDFNSTQKINDFYGHEISKVNEKAEEYLACFLGLNELQIDQIREIVSGNALSPHREYFKKEVK